MLSALRVLRALAPFSSALSGLSAPCKSSDVVGLLHFFLYDILRPRLLTQKSTTPSFSLSVLRRIKREPYNMPETEPLTHSLLLAASEHYLEERKRNGVPEAGEASEDQASDDDEDSDDGASGEHR